MIRGEVDDNYGMHLHVIISQSNIHSDFKVKSSQIH